MIRMEKKIYICACVCGIPNKIKNNNTGENYTKFVKLECKTIVNVFITKYVKYQLKFILTVRFKVYL